MSSAIPPTIHKPIQPIAWFPWFCCMCVCPKCQNHCLRKVTCAKWETPMLGTPSATTARAIMACARCQLFSARTLWRPKWVWNVQVVFVSRPAPMTPEIQPWTCHEFVISYRTTTTLGYFTPPWKMGPYTYIYIYLEMLVFEVLSFFTCDFQWLVT